jgi:hypothetical protein
LNSSSPWQIHRVDAGNKPKLIRPDELMPKLPPATLQRGHIELRRHRDLLGSPYVGTRGSCSRRLGPSEDTRANPRFRRFPWDSSVATKDPLGACQCVPTALQISGTSRQKCPTPCISPHIPACQLQRRREGRCPQPRLIPANCHVLSRNTAPEPRHRTQEVGGSNPPSSTPAPARLAAAVNSRLTFRPGRRRPKRKEWLKSSPRSVFTASWEARGGLRPPPSARRWWRRG